MSDRVYILLDVIEWQTEQVVQKLKSIAGVRIVDPIEGNPNVILCERGIRTFETYTRNTLDLSAVPALKELSHLPVIIDPTHGTGKVSLIEPMSLAAVAAGCDRHRGRQSAR